MGVQRRLVAPLADQNVVIRVGQGVGERVAEAARVAGSVTLGACQDRLEIPNMSPTAISAIGQPRYFSTVPSARIVAPSGSCPASRSARR
jgi:pyrrolidone-carboxylate peptidase